MSKEFKYNEPLKDNIQSLLYKVITNIYGDVFSSKYEIQVETPNNVLNGDLSSNFALILKNQLGENPLNIANKVVDYINDNKEVYLSGNGITEIVAVKPGFTNIFLSNENYIEELRKILLLRDVYGSNESMKGKKILIEHTSPNPNKEFHFGHWKTNLIGISISNLYRLNGANVFNDMVNNNRGIAIARLMWGYLKFARKEESTEISLDGWFENKDKWHTPESKGMSYGKFVDMLYTLASDDFKNSSEVEIKVRQMVVDWENGDLKNRTLWKLTQEWVWKGFRDILGRVGGWKFDQIWNEDEHYEKGKDLVEEGVNKGLFIKLEDGAVVTDFEKDFGITDTILIKRDGTSLYITQDLALTKLKNDKFNPDMMIWVVGPEQSLALKQMYCACTQLGIGDLNKFVHITYGFILVEGKDGKPRKMSSREGTGLFLSDYVDRARDTLINYIDEKSLTPEEKFLIAEKVGIASLKYSILKVSRLQDQVFSFDKSVSLEGDSGAYILYTYARAKSVLAKAGLEVGENDFFEFSNEYEISVLKHLSDYKFVCINALVEYSPSYVAKFIYELAQKFNNFYNSVQIINSEEVNKISRLALTKATLQILKNGLNVLGIETVDKM